MANESNYSDAERDAIRAEGLRRDRSAIDAAAQRARYGDSSVRQPADLTPEQAAKLIRVPDDIKVKAGNVAVGENRPLITSDMVPKPGQALDPEEESHPDFSNLDNQS